MLITKAASGPTDLGLASRLRAWARTLALSFCVLWQRGLGSRLPQRLLASLLDEMKWCFANCAALWNHQAAVLLKTLSAGKLGNRQALNVLGNLRGDLSQKGW